jgi:RNA polymerase sigma-70 factor, ECF subfamily
VSRRVVVAAKAAGRPDERFCSLLQEFLMIEAATFPLRPRAAKLCEARPAAQPATDYELARAAADGDTTAFEELYSRHSRRVYSLCLRMTANTAEAEDLSQEVFIQLYRKVGSFRGESQFTTWLHRLTVNQVLMHFRRRGVRVEQTTEDGSEVQRAERGTENPLQMPVVDRIALDKAVSQLPPGYRAVFVLHDVEGHEHEEVARLLGCSVGTSKSQLHKARMKLRQLLRQQNEPQ